jgi:hypothetical protein
MMDIPLHSFLFVYVQNSHCPSHDVVLFEGIWLWVVGMSGVKG